MPPPAGRSFYQRKTTYVFAAVAILLVVLVVMRPQAPGSSSDEDSGGQLERTMTNLRLQLKRRDTQTSAVIEALKGDKAIENTFNEDVTAHLEAVRIRSSASAAEFKPVPEAPSSPPKKVEKPEEKKMKPAPPGRKELLPRNTGCYATKNAEECCAAIDSRYEVHGPPFFGGQNCIPAIGGAKFKSGNKCEAESWVNTNDIENSGCCGPNCVDPTETLDDVLAKQKVLHTDKHAKMDPEDAHDLRIMWVTDCQLQLEWSSVLLLHSAFKVGQPGDFTRIATGCESARMRQFVIDSMASVAKIFNAEDRVVVHFAPKHVTDERDNTNGEVYTPYSKAFGVQHYLAHGKPHNRVGVIMDPDFVFNRPLEYRMDRVDPRAVIRGQHTKDWQHDVEPGRPVGQQYGLGIGWLNYELGEICGKDSPCTKVSPKDAWRYFTMGPPIFMTIDDWIKIANGWHDYLPIIRRKHKDWMEEMRSYQMSAAHNQQKTTIFKHFQISDKSRSPDDEGWQWIDGPNAHLPDPCREGKAINAHNYPDIDTNEQPYSPILHYCQAYEPEYYDKHYVWSKYQINFGIAQVNSGNLLDCDQPLYEDPPRDLIEAQVDTPSCLHERRQAWMLCQVQYSLNDMLVDFKTQKCGKEGYNKARTAKHNFPPRPGKHDHPDSCRKKRGEQKMRG